eukprot:ANDGO_05687.mRNA.1 RAN GTPase-activating protein 1
MAVTSPPSGELQELYRLCTVISSELPSAEELQARNYPQLCEFASAIHDVHHIVSADHVLSGSDSDATVPILTPEPFEMLNQAASWNRMLHPEHPDHAKPVLPAIYVAPSPVWALFIWAAAPPGAIRELRIRWSLLPEAPVLYFLLAEPSSKVTYIDGSGSGATPAEFAQLSDALCSGSSELQSSVQSIVLHHCVCETEGMAHLSKALSSLGQLVHLDLTGCRIGDRGTILLAEVLAQQNCRISYVGLSENAISGDGAEALAQAMRRGSRSVRVLDLSRNTIGGSGSRKFVSALQQNVSSETCVLLEELDLSWNSIKDSGATDVAELVGSLSQTAPRLHTIRIRGNMIKEEGSIALASGLKTLPAASSARSPLSRLDLSGNQVRDAGFAALCTALQHSACSLDVLSLSLCGISSKMISPLVEALASRSAEGKSSFRLRELDLSSNTLGMNLERSEPERARFSAFCTVLSSQPTLQILDLSENRISAQSAAFLAPALRTNRSLSTLRLKRNRIETAGLRSLIPALVENLSAPSSVLSLIDLGENEIGAEAIHALVDVLKPLDSNDNASTRSGVSVLVQRNAIPKDWKPHGAWHRIRVSADEPKAMKPIVS